MRPHVTPSSPARSQKPSVPARTVMLSPESSPEADEQSSVPARAVVLVPEALFAQKPGGVNKSPSGAPKQQPSPQGDDAVESTLLQCDTCRLCVHASKTTSLPESLLHLLIYQQYSQTTYSFLCAIFAVVGCYGVSESLSSWRCDQCTNDHARAVSCVSLHIRRYLRLSETDKIVIYFVVTCMKRHLTVGRVASCA